MYHALAIRNSTGVSTTYVIHVLTTGVSTTYVIHVLTTGVSTTYVIHVLTTSVIITYLQVNNRFKYQITLLVT